MSPLSPVVTMTLNPALDISSSVDFVAPTHKLRCAQPRSEPGGGGINVARVCARLGTPAVAVVALGGPMGDRVAELLAKEEIVADRIDIVGHTRQSISFTENSTGDQYRFVLPGPELTAEEEKRCKEQVIEAASVGTVLVISGSMPSGIDGSFITDVVAALPSTSVIVDTAGAALRAALQSGCHMVKPSARELAEIVGEELHTEADIETAARDLMSASRVDHLVVSLGPGGALAVSNDGHVLRVRAPAVRVASAVGAGDSMVAGLAVGVWNDSPLTESVALGVAAGSAAVLTAGTELCRSDEINRMLPLVSVVDSN
jgi:6-phosphofructokinase 2